MIGELIKILLLITIFIAFIYYPDDNNIEDSIKNVPNSEKLGQYIKLKSWLDKEGNVIYNKLENHSTKILDLKSNLIDDS
tara:strand:- start:1624 stop:1863 length:240 start_codon:yes stop_codon:yes gene_type:complete